MLAFLALLLTSLVPYSGAGAARAVEVNADDKVLVWAYLNPIGAQNSPHDSNSVYTADYGNSIYEGLMRRTIASDRAFVPHYAAADPVVSSDYKNWTFTLKPGLKFSDGSDLNASSVVFSYQMTMTASISTGYSGLSPYFTNSSVWAADELTVVFNMTQAYAFAPGLFSAYIFSEDYWGPQYDACLADVTLAACDMNTDLTGGGWGGGAGPFMMDNYDTTNNIVELVPNPFYFMADQIKIDRIVIRTIIDATAAKVAFAAGDTNIFDSQYKAKATDFANLAGITDVFVGAPGIQEMVPNHLHTYFGLGNYTTAIKTTTDTSGIVSGPEDARAARNIRKAMSHMVDRVFIADEITGGLGAPAATIMPTISIGWDETLLPRAYDIDIAKGYMEAAGFNYTGKTFDPVTGAMNSPFFSITVTSPTGNVDREQWAALMVQELPKIGIGITAHITSPFSALYPRTFDYPSQPPSYDFGGYDVFFVGWSFGLDFDPTGLYEQIYVNPSCCNVYNYNNATTETAIADYVAELDAALDYQKLNWFKNYSMMINQVYQLYQPLTTGHGLITL
jgi:ABC-type transport system substrate-binding protein